MTTKFLQVIQDAEAGVIRFTLGNGKVVTCKPKSMPEAIQTAACWHGFNQKIRDSAAGFSKDSDYAGAYRAMQSTLETLESGLWNAKGGASGESDLAQAVANLKEITLEKAAAAIAGLDEDQLKTLRGKASVKAELLRIKAERAATIAEASDDEDDILDL